MGSSTIPNGLTWSVRDEGGERKNESNNKYDNHGIKSDDNNVRNNYSYIDTEKK